MSHLKDFFISYTQADRDWAIRIAGWLEESGCSVVYQAGSILSGSNFIVEMDDAAKEAERTIALLSPDYLSALYPRPEWAAALARDPTGKQRLLRTVRVRECRPEGLLAQIVYIDLVGLDEAAARVRLLDGLAGKGPVAPLRPSLPEQGTLPDPGPLPAGSRLPFLRNPLFTGRRESLRALADALLYPVAGREEGRALIALAVTGMGGTGKSQLAVEFAYRFGRFLHGVHWLDARDPGLLESEVAACGLAMRLPGWPEKQPEQVACTLAAWREGGLRLVILDNLEGVQAAREWLPRLGVGAVRLLLTARRSSWPRDLGLAQLPLEVFSPDESSAFLRMYLDSGRAGEPEAQALAGHLGHLPLGLQLAARYLDAHPRLAVHDYLDRLEAVLNHPSMRAWRADLGDPTGHDLDLAKTFARSWLAVTDERARRLFLVCGYCAPNQPVPYELLERASELEHEACDEAVGLLEGLGLLRLDDLAAGPAIHPLLAEYAVSIANRGARERVRGEFDPLLALAAALADLCHEANETKMPARFYPLRPHLEAALPHAVNAGIERAGALWQRLGVHLRMIADYPRARVASERALAIDERAFGPDHPSVATDVNSLGLLLWTLGDFATARAALERALAIDERAYGPDHPLVGRDTSNLGMVLEDLGNLPAARAALERAVAIAERAHGLDDPILAIRVSNLGAVLHSQGDLAGAHSAYERALSIDERAYGPDHPVVAIRVNNLGHLLHELGDLAAARAALQRALTIWTATYAEDHPYLAYAHHNLGLVLLDLGDHSAARAALERALAIRDKALGRHHSLSARSLMWLGIIEAASGDTA